MWRNAAHLVIVLLHYFVFFTFTLPGQSFNLILQEVFYEAATHVDAFLLTFAPLELETIFYLVKSIIMRKAPLLQNSSGPA